MTVATLGPRAPRAQRPRKMTQAQQLRVLVAEAANAADDSGLPDEALRAMVSWEHLAAAVLAFADEMEAKRRKPADEEAEQIQPLPAAPEHAPVDEHPETTEPRREELDAPAPGSEPGASGFLPEPPHPVDVPNNPQGVDGPRGDANVPGGIGQPTVAPRQVPVQHRGRHRKPRVPLRTALARWAAVVACLLMTWFASGDATAGAPRSCAVAPQTPGGNAAGTTKGSNTRWTSPRSWPSSPAPPRRTPEAPRP